MIVLSEPYGQSGRVTGTATIPRRLAVSSAERSTAVASCIQPGKNPTLRPATGPSASNASRLGTLETSPGSVPEIAPSTSSVSSTLRAIGPSLSSDQQSVIAPVRATRPNVGLRPVTPQRIDGSTMLPSVSLPIEKPTRPAAVAAPGPALLPPEPSSRSH